MERLPPPYHNLTFTRHAQWRMQTRGITLDEVHTAIASGRRLGTLSNSLHYDPATWVGAIIDWHSSTVITVMNVWLTIDIPTNANTLSCERS